MDVKDLEQKTYGVTNIELEKQRMLEKAYHTMQQGRPLGADEISVLSEYTDTAQKLQKAKAVNLSIESLVPPQKMANAEIEKEEKEDFRVEIKEKKANALTYPPVPPSEEEVLLASLIKDTPSGNYSNTLAKMRAETDNEKENYTRAFAGLQEKGRQNFNYILSTDSELSHPDRIDKTTTNFNLLNEFAPALASNPVTAKSFIRKMDSYGDQIDEKTIGELIKTNSEFMKHQVKMV